MSWRHPEDELPELGEAVIVTTDSGRVGVGWRYSDHWGAMFYPACVEHYTEITAWQPLPSAPYRPGGRA